MNSRLRHVCVRPWPNTSSAAGPETLRVDFASPHDGREDWAVLMPGGHPDAWIVIFHGHGSEGDQLLARPDMRDLWLPAIRSAGLGIFCPNLRGNSWMSPATADDLHQLLGWIGRRYAPRRTLLAGGSMGGTAALIYAALYPKEVDGVVALCPAADLPGYWRWAARRAAQQPILGQIAAAIEEHYGTTPDASPERFARHSALAQHQRLTMPIALAHGTADAVIPIEPTRQLAVRLRERRDVFYRELAGGNHDAPLVTFPDALKWVLGLL